MTPSHPESENLDPAVDVFARFVARVEDGEDVDFESFVAEQSGLESDLRRLHAQWRSTEDAFDKFAGTRAMPQGAIQSESVAARLLSDLGQPHQPSDRYTERGEVARGGMGVIIEVWDRSLGRVIAMKTLHDRGTDPHQLGRFLDEAKVTGQLEHPGIVPVHELGIDTKGRVYFTMPLIRGDDFKAVIDLLHASKEGWSLQRALVVLLRVCEAMAYAHDKGVIHRDLKPANIMVGRFGETYVMDWGLARILGEAHHRKRPPSDKGLETSFLRSHRKDAAETPDSPLLTMEGDVIGTPAYMAPEQARGEVGEIGVHTDVYSVGAMLYHLLSAQPPYMTDGTTDSLLILQRVVAGPPVRVQTVNPHLAPELVAICEHAMARSKKARYENMLELVEDLRSFLGGRVVLAYESGRAARLRKWIKRNRWLASTGALALLFLVVGLVVSVGGFVTANAHARRADASAGDLAEQLTASNIDRGRLFAKTGNLMQAEELLWSEHLRSSNRNRTSWALWDLYSHEPCLASTQAHSGVVSACMVTPDRRRLVTASFEGGIKIWDVGTLRCLATIVDPGTWIQACVLSPEGSTLAFAARDESIVLWDLTTNRETSVLEGIGKSVTCLRFSPDGSTLASGSRDETIRLWQLASGTSTVLGSHRGGVSSLAFDGSGTALAAGHVDGSISLWDLENKRLNRRWDAHRGSAGAVLFSADGRQLYSGGTDKRICIWDVDRGGNVHTISGDNGSVHDLVLSSDGQTLYAAGWWQIQCWDLPTRTLRRVFSITIAANSLCLDESRQVLVSGHGNGSLRLWDLASDRSARHLPGHDTRVAADCSPDGTLVATGDSAGVVRLWDLNTGDVRTLAGGNQRVKSLAFSPDGALLVAGDMDGKLRIWQCSDGALHQALEGHDASSAKSAVFSPDGKTLALIVDLGGVELRDMESGRRVAAWTVSDRQVLNLAFDPGGQILATTDRSNHIKWWSLRGELVHEWQFENTPWSLAFSSDGRHFASGFFFKKILVFDVETKQVKWRLAGHRGSVWDIAFSPDNPNLLASVSADTTVRLWDLESGQHVATLTRANLSVSFSRDGQTLVTGGSDGRVSAWDLTYFGHHVAGNTEFQLAQSASTVIEPNGLKRAAHLVLDRDWPRWGR